MPVVEGTGTTEGRRSRVGRGRPNWWVILAVSLALMALLVATAGNPARVPRRPALANDAPRGSGPASTTTTTTSLAPATTDIRTPSTSLLSSRLGTTGAVGLGAPTNVAPPTTTTTPTPVATTTTSAPPASQPSDRTSWQGVIEPPEQRSSTFGFTGAGAMEVSVVWSGATYLTMEVACANGSQSVGGTSAMAASLPDASGNCLATVSEPSSESTALTYTIMVGPAGG
jgi:hypothetical protein